MLKITKNKGFIFQVMMLKGFNQEEKWKKFLVQGSINWIEMIEIISNDINYCFKINLCLQK